MKPLNDVDPEDLEEKITELLEVLEYNPEDILARLLGASDESFYKWEPENMDGVLARLDKLLSPDGTEVFFVYLTTYLMRKGRIRMSLIYEDGDARCRSVVTPGDEAMEAGNFEGSEASLLCKADGDISISADDHFDVYLRGTTADMADTLIPTGDV